MRLPVTLSLAGHETLLVLADEEARPDSKNLKTPPLLTGLTRRLPRLSGYSAPGALGRKGVDPCRLVAFPIGTRCGNRTHVLGFGDRCFATKLTGMSNQPGCAEAWPVLLFLALGVLGQPTFPERYR